MISLLPITVMLTSALAAIPIALSKKHPNLREFWTLLAATIKVILLVSMIGWVASGHFYQFTLCKILFTLKKMELQSIYQGPRNHHGC